MLNYKIKSHIKVILLGISDSSKKESTCYHRLVSLQIDSRPSQDVTHPKSGKSDVALQNATSICNGISFLCGTFWRIYLVHRLVNCIYVVENDKGENATNTDYIFKQCTRHCN